MSEIEFFDISEGPKNQNSVFEGTPWTSDQEIYDYVVRRKFEEEWTWEAVRESLIESGLPSYYTDAIIENSQAEGQKAKKIVRLRGWGEVALSIIIFIVGLFIVMTPYYELKTRGYIMWIVGSMALLIDGVQHLKREF